MENNQTPIVMRFKFKKVGKLQFISHLDLVRTMHKVIVRAGLPLWYTEGFNPKPKMVFAAPLSTGTESVTEFMDLRLSEVIPPEEALAALNKNMTDELQVLSAWYPKTKPTDLKWLSYTITVSSPAIDGAMVEATDAALSLPEIRIIKRTKSGDQEVDIRPMIHSASAALSAPGVMRISCTLSADSQSFLNPEYVIKYLRDRVGLLTSENLLSESYSIMRENAYTADMAEFI